MHTEKRNKVVQVWIVIKRVGVAVMRKRMLVLPHDGVAQERHGPNSRVVDPGSSTGSEMAGIMAQRANQPSENCQHETSQDASLYIGTVRNSVSGVCQLP